jgi:hypothetical protein
VSAIYVPITGAGHLQAPATVRANGKASLRMLARPNRAGMPSESCLAGQAEGVASGVGEDTEVLAAALHP